MKAMAPSSTTEIALYSRELDTSPRSLGFTLTVAARSRRPFDSEINLESVVVHSSYN